MCLCTPKYYYPFPQIIIVVNFLKQMIYRHFISASKCSQNIFILSFCNNKFDKFCKFYHKCSILSPWSDFLSQCFQIVYIRYYVFSKFNAFVQTAKIILLIHLNTVFTLSFYYVFYLCYFIIFIKIIHGNKS